MILHTRQSLANSAAQGWEEHYGRLDSRHYSEHQALIPKLHALGPTPDPDDVDALIGNDSWTAPRTCSECQREAAAVVEIGEPPDYESSTAWICRRCLENALALFTGDS